MIFLVKQYLNYKQIKSNISHYKILSSFLPNGHLDIPIHLNTTFNNYIKVLST